MAERAHECGGQCGDGDVWEAKGGHFELRLVVGGVLGEVADSLAAGVPAKRRLRSR